MAKLNSNTVVANPETGQPVVLLEGDAVPGWATDLVGSHLTEVLPDQDPDGGSTEPPSGPAGYDPAVHTIPDVLEYVGDDREKAADVLAAEQARGDKARSSLVEKLEAAATPTPEEDPSAYTVPDLLEYVGDDQAKAASVLAAEQARGDDARSSLTEKLAKVAEPAPAE